MAPSPFHESLLLHRTAETYWQSHRRAEESLQMVRDSLTLLACRTRRPATWRVPLLDVGRALVTAPVPRSEEALAADVAAVTGAGRPGRRAASPPAPASGRSARRR